eukprot:CAMPEP_0174254164 /NCGR_PEP_ID=MMETSP0439-20130205/3509_1 /TAXON_ID=0 /ORGANISM="Stereomyxa ramosa, Strain Chinc5" /LENGTH=329 /DNA_ID=CAMNT_0015335605 /DNA_START=11 /DNA_END=1000 /DNA_ORIENTATION=-
MNADSSIVQPLDALLYPRFSGLSTFARLPRTEDVKGRSDVTVIGIPFDAGCSYRPGARFGPAAVRQASRLLRTYSPQLNICPFKTIQVTDGGDFQTNPFNIGESITKIEQQATAILSKGSKLICIGGDHTVALPLLRAMNKKYGKVALLHFDAHLDTWDTYFNEPYTHGTPFRRASEEGLFDESSSMHIGIRGPIYDPQDLIDDEEMGFKIVHCMEFQTLGVEAIVQKIKNRVGNRPLYISIDIDVLDPAFAPGTGTPEIGGMTSRELQQLVRGLKGMNIVSCDVVEVSPSYDHAELTSLAAAALIYELLSLIALNHAATILPSKNSNL